MTCCAGCLNSICRWILKCLMGCGDVMPCQVIMSAHKELALNEKQCHVRFGGTCVTGYGDVIHSSAYDSFESFFSALQAAWDQQWVEVFSADPAGASAQLQLTPNYWWLVSSDNNLWAQTTICCCCWRCHSAERWRALQCDACDHYLQ